MKYHSISKKIIFFVCLVFALIIIVPFLIIIINSFKGAREAALFSLTLPKQVSFDNYQKVLQYSQILRGFVNSIVLSVGTVIFTNLFAAMAAFVIQRQGDRLHKIIYIVFLMGIIIPIPIIPTIRLMMLLNVHNTYIGIILYYIAINLPFTVFLFTGYMKSIPRELDESVFMEGGSYFTLFSRIIFPLLSPALVTSTIIVMVRVWNDFMGPFYLISDSRKWTVILNVFNFISMYQTNWGVVFAFMAMVITPLLIIYFFLQKYIISGLTAGSLKG